MGRPRPGRALATTTHILFAFPQTASRSDGRLRPRPKRPNAIAPIGRNRQLLYQLVECSAKTDTKTEAGEARRGCHPLPRALSLESLHRDARAKGIVPHIRKAHAHRSDRARRSGWETRRLVAQRLSSPLRRRPTPRRFPPTRLPLFPLPPLPRSAAARESPLPPPPLGSSHPLHLCASGGGRRTSIGRLISDRCGPRPAPPRSLPSFFFSFCPRARRRSIAAAPRRPAHLSPLLRVLGVRTGW